MDRWALDQFRPYIIMMNTRAKSSLMLKKNPVSGIEEAIDLFDNGIRDIIDFYQEYGIISEIETSVELSLLKALKSEYLRKSPPTLEEELDSAIHEERFEDAAIIRDRLNAKHKKE